MFLKHEGKEKKGIFPGTNTSQLKIYGWRLLANSPFLGCELLTTDAHNHMFARLIDVDDPWSGNGLNLSGVWIADTYFQWQGWQIVFCKKYITDGYVWFLDLDTCAHQ